MFRCSYEVDKNFAKMAHGTEGVTHMIMTSSGEHFVLGPEFELFAHALFASDGASALDVQPTSDESLFLEYSKIGQERLSLLAGSNELLAQTDAELAAFLDLESITWKLLQTLIDIRVPSEDTFDSIQPHAFASDQALVSYLMKKDQSLAENAVILNL
ncbi:hypothetical protein BC830DRAFT_758226 [Chytriomyces sp. MP71]|nr:hypothetical protein BC830DRAFT_758226 [Chytriomyces sp. MP71]